MVRTFQIYSLSSFQGYNIVLLTLCTRSPVFGPWPPGPLPWALTLEGPALAVFPPCLPQEGRCLWNRPNRTCPLKAFISSSTGNPRISCPLRQAIFPESIFPRSDHAASLHSPRPRGSGGVGQCFQCVWMKLRICPELSALDPSARS